MSKIISKVFKVKIEDDKLKKANENKINTKNNIDISTNDNDNNEKNKNKIFKKLKSKLGKHFNIYLMNSKIIDNDNENHNSKIEYFLRENILFFFNNFFDNFKEKIDMLIPREILSIILNILVDYEVECGSVFEEIQDLLNKMDLILIKEEKQTNPISVKLNSRRLSTNKKLRKSKLSKKRTRITILSKLEKGATKIDKYFTKSNIKQEINFENVENSKKNFNNKQVSIKNNELNYFLKEKISPGFFNFNNVNPRLAAKSAAVTQYPTTIRGINKQGTFSTIFERETNLNESHFSNHGSNRLNESRGSRISQSKETKKQELNYRNYFKNSILKSRNYANNHKAVNFDNYSTVSLIESSGHPFNYNYSNISHISQNNYLNQKFININNSFSHLKSANQSFECENYSEQRKSSNVTFGFQLSNNTNANNLNNSNILNSSFFNNTEILTNNISMTAGSNTLNEKLYDELNGNLELKSNLLQKQNSCEAITANSDIINYNSVNNLQMQGSNSNLFPQQKSEKSETVVCSPQNYLLYNNSDNLSKISSGEFNNKIKKPRGNINFFTHPIISSSKSTNHSVISNSNNSQFSLIQHKSNKNLNQNSNFEFESKDNLTPFMKKITLSFNDNDSNLLNSSFYCDSQSIHDSENKKANKSYGLNNRFHNRIDNLPKMKKIKNGSSGKKIKNNKKCENKFISMIFNKLEQERDYSNLNESIDVSISHGELDSKSNYIIKEDSKSVETNNRNKSIKSDKANNIKNLVVINNFYNKQKEDLIKNSPQILKSPNNTNTKSAKKYKNANIKNYLSEEKPKRNFNNEITNSEDLLENNHQKNKEENPDTNGYKPLNESTGKLDVEIKSANIPQLKEITKSNLAESIANVKNRNSQTTNSLNKVSTRSAITAETCPTTASGGSSIIKTRSANLKAYENPNINNMLLNKKRKLDTSNEEIENNKNAYNIILEKNKIIKKNANKKVNKTEEHTKKNEGKNIRKASLASNTDDEVLAFQTPDKRQEICKVKFSPNTVSRKNLMELFAQIKKN